MMSSQHQEMQASERMYTPLLVLCVHCLFSLKTSLAPHLTVQPELYMYLSKCPPEDLLGWEGGHDCKYIRAVKYSIDVKYFCITNNCINVVSYKIKQNAVSPILMFSFEAQRVNVYYLLTQ